MSLARIRLLMWKEVLQLSRDTLLLPLIFIMPLLQLIMFGYVVGSDVRDLPTAIIDADGSAAARSLTDALGSSGYFDITQRLDDERELQPLMDASRVQVALMIPAGFSDDLERGGPVPVQIVVDGSDSKAASVAGGYAAQTVAEWNRRRLERSGMRVEGPGIDTRVRVLFNPTLRAVNTMIPGLVAMILMLSVTAIMSQSVVRERERGTLEQMFVTPIRRGEYLIGKVTPYVIISSIQVALIMIVGRLWFHVPFHGNPFVVAVGLLLFLFTAIGQGLIVSMLSRTRQQAQQATMFIMIPTMVLSGFIFPIEAMPDAIVPLTYLIPLRYALEVLRAASMKGSGFAALAAPLAAMAVFGVAVFGVALARFHKRLSD